MPEEKERREQERKERKEADFLHPKIKEDVWGGR